MTFAQDQNRMAPRPTCRLGRVLASITLLGVTFGATACGNSPTATPSESVTVTATATTTATTTATATASADPPPRKTRSPRPAADGWRMPDEVGGDLQDAQDDIQRISGDPFFYTSSKDATGQGSFQVLDRDWTVCSQRPAAGTTFDADTGITFYVVKDWEHCPG